MSIYSENKKQQTVFILEAAFEYFVAIMIGGASLTSILNQAGVPDSVSGVLSSLAILSYAAQLVSANLDKAKGKYKTAMCILRSVNELMFALLYVVPFFDIPSNVKTLLLVTLLMLGQLIMNFTTPSKLNWLVSMVPDKQRGAFNARKEAFSLVTGMIFTIIMGRVIDYYKEIGETKTGFYICCAVVIVSSVFHIVCITLCRKPQKAEEKKTGSVCCSLKSLFNNKTFRMLIVVDILWHATTGASAFGSVYQLNTLGFSLTFISVIGALSSVARIFVSFPMGKYADRKSWAHMMRIAFCFAGLAFLFYSFSSPSNGKIVFSLYTVFYAVSMAGINSGLSNITFDYISPDDRTTAIGIKYALGGLVGFGASLLGGVVVGFVQKMGNCVFGLTIYPQQLIAFFMFLDCMVICIYISKVIFKLKRVTEKTQISDKQTV